MDSILILGAGRSATSLINYLIGKAPEHGWSVTVADLDESLAKEKAGDNSFSKGLALDISDSDKRKSLVKRHRVVISMLPPHLHVVIAHDCLEFGCHLLTASYLSEEIADLHTRVSAKKLLFLFEMGLDPGIDHMSAMALKEKIEQRGGEVFGFHSSTGGLISRRSDTNPWHYKVTWNPRNVVLAGQGTAVFKEDGQIKFLPYHQLFENFRMIEMVNGEQYEMYPNRDSIRYCDLYNLRDVKTLIRGTLRHPEFCSGWAGLVRLGLTDDQLAIAGEAFDSYRSLLLAFLPSGNQPVEEKIYQRLGKKDASVARQILWLFDDSPIEIPRQRTMAQHLQDLIVIKWKLQAADRDLVVMHHRFDYTRDGKKWRTISTLSQEGLSSSDTAMTRLVGLPLAISTELILTNKLTLEGVQIPVRREIYEPVLARLEELGVHFEEETSAF